MTVCDFLLETSARHPAHIAFRFVDPASPNGSQEIAITYRELATRSRHLAARLWQSGLDERAILLYPAGLDFIVALFACLFAGIIAIPIPVPKSVRSDAFRKIMEDAKPRFILSTSHLRRKLDKENAFANEHPACEWMILEAGSLDTPEEEIALPRRELNDIAYLQYTSGSTSSPRGVIVSHRNVIANCTSVAKKWRMEENSIGVSWLPHFHDMGLITTILLPIVSGCTSVLLPPATIATPLLWLRAIDRFRGTHSHAPSVAFQACVDKVSPEEVTSLDLSCWQVAMCGAEPIRQSTVEQFLERFAQAHFDPNALRPGYGLAEATLVVTDVGAGQQFRSRRLDVSSLAAGFAKDTPDPAGIAVVSCGCLIEDADVAIIDPKTFRACPDNTIGEIWVHGPSVAAGYWNDSERTQETFHGGSPDYPERFFLRTGDLGFRDRGEIFVSGRLKDLIIIRGRNIYPNDIEELSQGSHAALRSMGTAAFAVARDDGEQLVIVQEVRRVKRHQLEGVIDAIRQRITSDMDISPYSVVLVNEFSIPRTTSGKIRRKFCQEQYLAGNLSVLDSWTLPELVLPATKSAALDPMESRAGIAVLEIVARRTGFSPNAINREKSFADYGFDSNAAVEAAADLSRLLGRKLESSLLYDQPTVAKLIAHLETLGSTDKLKRNGATRSSGATRHDGAMCSNGSEHAADLFLSRVEDEPGVKHI